MRVKNQKKSKQPFAFYTRLHLTELTGVKASNLMELLEGLKSVEGGCIYHHTHRFLEQHIYATPQHPNDFAYWVTEVLGEEELGEKLASIDTVSFRTIRSLRERLISTIEDYIENNPKSKLKFANSGQEFHFIKSISFILPTGYKAYTFKEFVEILSKISLDSIYFHMFEARLRLKKGTNDFSFWIEKYLGDKELADKISKLDPYTYTLEGIRETIVNLIEGKYGKNR